MKSKLKIEPHQMIAGETVIEVWYDGKFIATVTGADGPGVRVISKHPVRVRLADSPPPELAGVTEIRLVIPEDN